MKDSILIVDDEEKVISSLKRALMEEPYEVFSAGSGSEGLSFLERRPVKVIISDERMPGMPGAEFLAAVRERMPETVRIMLTGHASLEAAMRAVNSGEIYRFFVKPWNDVELMLAIRSALEKFNLEAENRRLLKIVKRQALDLKLLEKKYPSITKLQKDERGNLVLPDVSEKEFSEIVALCEKEFS
jgi:two-component system probable response regulator PhcQ